MKYDVPVHGIPHSDLGKRRPVPWPLHQCILQVNDTTQYQGLPESLVT